MLIKECERFEQDPENCCGWRHKFVDIPLYAEIEIALRYKDGTETVLRVYEMEESHDLLRGERGTGEWGTSAIPHPSLLEIIETDLDLLEKASVAELTYFVNRGLVTVSTPVDSDCPVWKRDQRHTAES